MAFVGTAAGIEATVVPRERFPLDLIRSAGLKGKSLASLVRGLALLPVSAWDAWRVITRRAPDVVVGVGGYSSGPVVALAALRGIPTLVMEQNAAPGLTNRLLARVVRAAAVTFEASVARFGGKAFVAGNPVRPEFFQRAARSDRRTALRVLVFGGSQGAHAINLAMAAAAGELARQLPRRARHPPDGAARRASWCATPISAPGSTPGSSRSCYEMHRRCTPPTSSCAARARPRWRSWPRPASPPSWSRCRRPPTITSAPTPAAMAAHGAAVLWISATPTARAWRGRLPRWPTTPPLASAWARAASGLARPARRRRDCRPHPGPGWSARLMLGRTRRVHFVGVGGIGMSGIAELLANLGYAVSGSDAKRSDGDGAAGERCGVRVHEGHAAAHVGDADVVVYSSAVRPDNPELVEARRRGIPVIPRAEMLAELMRLKFSIAVAGSHGKTTTTSMIALVLERAGLDPTAVIGGRLSAFGSNARLGRGQYMVAEADESDRSFLVLWPSIAVITNIDDEHLEAYGRFEDLQQAFVDFANKVPFYGSVVACADDPQTAAILPRVTRRLVTYGLDGGATVVGQGRRAGRVRRAVHGGGAARRRRAPRSGRIQVVGAGPPQPAERARGRGRRRVPGRRVRPGGRGAGRVPRRRAPVSARRRGARRAGGGRLRPSPDRDRRGAGRGAAWRSTGACWWRSSRTATRGRPG